MARAKKPNTSKANAVKPTDEVAVPKDPVAGKSAVSKPEKTTKTPDSEPDNVAPGADASATAAALEGMDTVTAEPAADDSKTPSGDDTDAGSTSATEEAGPWNKAPPPRIESMEPDIDLASPDTSPSTDSGESAAKDGAAKDGNDEGAVTEGAHGKDAEIDAVLASEPPAAVAPPPTRSGFFPLLLGGVIAAALGFVAGRGDVLDAYLPASLQRPAPDTSAQDARIAALEQSIADAVQAAAPTPALANGETDAAIAGLDTTINSLALRVDAVEQRADALADQLRAQVSAAQASSDQMTTEQMAANAEQIKDIAALSAAVAQQRDEVAALIEEARSAQQQTAAVAERAAAREALTRIIAAVNNGSPFPEALSDLEQTGAVDVPPELRSVAETGVATLAELQANFPATARIGLSAARLNAPTETGGGIGSFLQRQLGARSVIPRDGPDPDAVLSRAEAAVKQGRLADALTEIDTLPDPAKAEMSEWVDAATVRLAAETAADSLAQRLTAN